MERAPFEGRPIVKSGFRQIPPNRLQHKKRITRVERLSVTIEQCGVEVWRGG